MRILILVAVLWALPARADGPDGPRSFPSRADAARLLAPPAGSLSEGRPGSGRLLRGVRMSLKGPGYAFLPFVRHRGTQYATSELDQLMRRVASTVAKAHPGSVLRIGNIGVKGGGKIHWSVSHQSGRDADIGMYATDLRGAPKTLKAFLPFDRHGLARGRYRFDDARNLTLVVALVLDERAPVQWILVAEWLKERLMDRARLEGRAEAVIARLDQVLQQPWLSSPHHDHFHVRIYCPVTDRLHGCVDRGRVWRWAVRGERRVRKRARALVSMLRMPSAAHRRRALDSLRRMGAPDVAGPSVAALSDRDKGVRKAALRALGALRDPRAVPLLAAQLRAADRPGRAKALLAVLLRHRDEGSLSVARAVVTRPRSVLHSRLPQKAVHSLREQAIAHVAWAGGVGDLQPLMDLLDDRSGAVRRAAANGLGTLTGNWPRRPLSARPLRSWWHRWRDKYGHRSQADWLFTGLVKRGYRLDGSPLDPGNVRVMIRALSDHSPAYYHVASRLMSRVTGFKLDPRRRTRRITRRLWKTWWRLHARDHGAQAAVRRGPRPPDFNPGSAH